MLPHGGFVLYNRHVLVVIQVVLVVVEDVDPVVERVRGVVEVAVLDEVRRGVVLLLGEGTQADAAGKGGTCESGGCCCAHKSP